MAASLLCFLAFSFINFWAASMQWIVVGALLQGISSGGFGTLASTYISDVCPPSISNILTGFISCCWIIGQLCSYSILWLMVGVQGARAYRIPMAMQWIIPVPVILGCWLAPSSPWALVRQGKTAAAYCALRKLTSSPTPIFSTAPDKKVESNDTAALRLLEIQQAVAVEAEKSTVGASFKQCFRGANLRRTEISLMTNVSQIIVGFAIASQIINFIRLAGLKSADSIKMAFCKMSLKYVQQKL